MAMKTRTEIADYITANKQDRARIRVEHIISEDYVVEAFEILEMYCHLLLGRFGRIEQMKTLDDGIAEAVISVMWAAPRLTTDIAEFKSISDQLTVKYGKPFAEVARANQSEFPAKVNPKVIAKLGAAAPPKLLVERYMIEIAAAAGVPFVADPDVMKTASKVSSSIQMHPEFHVKVCITKSDHRTNVTFFFTSEGKEVIEIDGISMEEKKRTAVSTEDVTAIAAFENFLAVATGLEVHLLQNDQYASIRTKVEAEVRTLLFAGTKIVAIDAMSGVHVLSADSTSSLKLDHHWTGSADFVITYACLPDDTYINKVRIGSASGRMRIFNFANGQTVHQFEKRFESKLSIIQLSSCDDTVAMGCDDGKVLLYELNKKKIRCSMSHEKSISCIAFRRQRKTMMIVGEETGKVSIWNFYKEALLKSFQPRSGSIQEIHLLPNDRNVSSSIKVRAAVNRLLFSGTKIIATDFTSGVHVSPSAQDHRYSWIIIKGRSPRF